MSKARVPAPAPESRRSTRLDSMSTDAFAAAELFDVIFETAAAGSEAEALDAAQALDRCRHLARLAVGIARDLAHQLSDEYIEALKREGQ